MRHEVIVCTKDRPDELRRCLSALALQDIAADRIMVVDSSSAIKFRYDTAGECPVVHLTAPAGLTRQRNIGLAQLLPDTQVVHFLDDDAVPEPGYLLQMLTVFEKYGDAAGAGAKITNMPTHVPWAVERFFCLNSRRQGALLRSGINVLSFDGENCRKVDWLSGCCMSYRVDRLHGLSFDERRTGNGLGEDVDFSARVRTRGSLVWWPAARMAHLQSPVNRSGDAYVTRRGVVHRWHLAVDGVGGVKRIGVVYATVGLIVVSLGRAALGRRSALLGAKAAALGLVDLLSVGRR